MISNTDLEKAWFLYKTEAQPRGMSINEFCQNKGIPYHEFEKWYKKTHRTVAPVEIIGKPEQIGIKKQLKKHQKSRSLINSRF